MRVTPGVVPQPLGLVASIFSSGTNMMRGATAFADLGTRVRPWQRGVGSARARPWQRLFCSAFNEQQQGVQHQQYSQQEDPRQREVSPPGLSQRQWHGPGKAVKLNTAALLELEEGTPLQHSNPDIQVLLDRYSRMCDNQADMPAVSPVFGKADRRSPSRAVFSNTNVDLSRVEVVGFDYDYTLATCECACLLSIKV